MDTNEISFEDAIKPPARSEISFEDAIRPQEISYEQALIPNAPQTQIPSTRIPSAFSTDAPTDPVPPSPVFKNPDVIAETTVQPSLVRSVAGTAVRNAAPLGAAVLATKIAGPISRAAGARLGSLGGAALGALVPAADLTGIPEVIGGVVGGILGFLAPGMIAAMGTKEAQNKIADTIAPNSEFGTKQETAETTAHPVATTVTSLLTLGKPSPMNFVRSAKTLATSEGNKALLALAKTAGDKEALRSWQAATPEAIQKGVQSTLLVAQSGGINAAFNAADQIRQGNYSLTDLLKAAGEGAIFSQPWIHAKNPATKAFDDAVNPQPQNDNAGEIQSATSVSQPEIRTPVGQSPPLRQPRQAAGAFDQLAPPSGSESVAQKLGPQTIIKGIEARPIDADNHIVSVNGKDAAFLKFVDETGMEAAQQSVGAKGWEGFFLNPDKTTGKQTIYINRDALARGPIFTHETTHLLDAMGLVTPEQMDSVVEKYGQKITQEVKKRYENFRTLNELKPLEPIDLKREVFANIFQNWHENNNAPKVTWIHRAIDFVRNIAGLAKTGRANAQDILAGKFTEPTVKDSLTVQNAPSVPQEKKKITTIVYSGGPANRTRQSVFENVNNVFYGNRGGEFKYIDSGNLDEKGHRIFIPDSITKPDPNWRVTVQPNEFDNGKEIPSGYVQIDNVTGGVNKWSSSPEKLAQKGIQVPDFSKLPKGQYTYAEAVKAVENKSGQNLLTDQGSVGEADTARLTNKAPSKSGSDIPDRVAKPIPSAKITGVKYTIRPNGKFDVHLQTDFEGSKVAGGGTLAMENNLTYDQLVSKVGKNAADAISSDSGQNKRNESGWRYGEFNLQPDSTPQFSIPKDQTETPEFKKWFGESKTVDGKGRPIVFYHGTDADISQFHESDWGYSGPGIYFTQSPEIASRYAGVPDAGKFKGQQVLKNGNIAPVFLKINKPFGEGVLSAEDAKIINDFHRKNLYAIKDIATEGMTHKRFFEKLGAAADDNLKDYIEHAGYDGVFVKGGHLGDEQEVVVFKPEQIKSAIGNSGAFDPKNPDIRFSVPKGGPSKEPQRASQTKREKFILDAEKEFNAAQSKNKAVVDHQKDEHGELWNVYSSAKGNDKQAVVFKKDDGTYDVRDENDMGIGYGKDDNNLDRALQSAKDHVESGSTQDYYEAHRNARSDILHALDLPPDFRIKDIQDTKWDSVYYLLQKKISEDADGEPEYENFKISIRNHEPSPFREKEFGANDAWYEIPKDASLEQIAKAVSKVENFAWRHSDSGDGGVRFSVPKENRRDRAQVGGIPRVGQERDTESIASNQEHIRANLFDSTQPVSDESTFRAWEEFSAMTGKDKSRYAARARDEFGNSRLILGLYKGEIWRYARKMAIAGDDSLLRAMYDHSNDFETLTGGGASEAGSALRSEGENAGDPVNRAIQDAWQTEREIAAQKGAKIDRELFFKLLKNLRDLKLKPEEVEAAVNDGKLPDGKTIDETLKTVKPKVKPPEETDADIATQIAKEKLEELRVKYEGAEWLKPEGGRNAVLQVIEDALKGQSRDAEGKIIIGPNGKPQIAPILDVSKPLAESTAEKLTKLGVEPDVAGEIGYQIESARKTEFANRRTKALNAAANSRNIRSLIDSILETPYRAQSDPKWLHETAIRWFESNGLGKEQAEAAARLFENRFKEALSNASNKIATDLLKKGAPKSYEDLWKMIRAGIFDPTRDWVTKLAEATGWKKPTTEQMVKLQELEHKLTSPELSPEEVANINEQQMRVLRHVGKKDGATLRALGESFTASLLSGIRTFTVQTSPLMMAFRDLTVMIASDPKNAFNFAKAMYNSFKANAVASFKYAWMKDAYGFHLNELEHGFNEMKRISEQTDEVIADKKSTSTQKALAYVKKLYALQRFVFRNLNSLDQASMAVTREWKMAYYTSQAFKEAGLSTSDISQLVDNVEMARRNEFEKAMDEGLDATTAKVRANSRVQDAVWDFVNNKTGNSDLANQVLKASENDTYSTVGRVPKDMSGLDEGLLTRYSGFNDFLQFVSKVRGKGGLQNIGATAMLGMINIPFRTMRYFSDFSPYGLLRYGIYKYRNNRGLDNYWKQTYGNALQARARLWSAIAGTVALGAASAWALKNSTSDEHAGDEDFGLYITGKGPQNKVLADAWSKRGFKQYSANFVINGRIISIPLTRAGESFLFPFILPAAADDYAWKVKEAEAKGHPLKNKPSAFTSTLIGEALSMTGQSGILQTFGQLQQATENGGSLAKAAVKTGVGAASAVALPFKQLLSSLSEMMVGSLDNSSISSLIANQFPVVGLPFQTPAINRFGDPLYDRSWYGLASRTGVPLAFQIARSDANDRLYTTLVDKGVAPTPLNRSDIEAKYGDLTDDQFKKFATISGQTLKKSVESNLADIQTMPSDEAHKLIGKLSNDANAAAVAALGLQQTAKAQTASNGAQGQPAGNQAHQPKTSKKYSVSRKRKPGSSFYNLRNPHVRALKSPKSKKTRTGSLYGLRPRRLYGVNN